MTEGLVRYDARDGVAILTIAQAAKLNAMSFGMWEVLPELVRRAETDPSVRVIVLRGEGEKAFCAGADISQFGEKRSEAEAIADYDRVVERGNAALRGAEKPTVALVRGICFGGGLGLAIACDLRFASSDSRFRIPAARLGLGYGFSNVKMLVSRLGRGVTADLLLSARIVDAGEAVALGIVNAVRNPSDFEEEAARYVERIAHNAPLTLKAVKRALAELETSEPDAAAVDALVAACYASRDYHEGRAAFRDKREPLFTGE
jgi:enoyl-CoA hydratase/carnithine racemase